MYPRDSKEPARAGRLRLLYEVNPIAFIVEQAGGLASTGRERILDIVPNALHQRVPLIFGARGKAATMIALRKTILPRLSSDHREFPASRTSHL